MLADGLTHTLGQSGYRITVSGSVAGAQSMLLAQDFDLIVLDLSLPDGDGMELLRKLRQRKVPLPVIILTARDGINDRIDGIEQGADDYLTKPFELRELEARIHALIRRCYGGFSKDIVIGGLTLDTVNHQILADGLALAISRREYNVLEILLLQAGKVAAKERIAQRLADDGEALSDNAIEIIIHRLRKRLQNHDVTIRTIRGLGYLLEPSNND